MRDDSIFFCEQMGKLIYTVNFLKRTKKIMTVKVKVSNSLIVAGPVGVRVP